jgi:nitrate reductase delta subunit
VPDTGAGAVSDALHQPGGTPVELLRGLAVFAEPPTLEHVRLTEVLGLPSVPTASEYSDVFLFQLYPYASVHLGAEGMMGGEARERVAGFWTALGQTPPAEPDHLATLLGLYVGLVEQSITVESRTGPHSAEAVLVRQSRAALMQEHLAPWVFPFLDRVLELAPGPYGAWATLLSEALGGEVRRDRGGRDEAVGAEGRTGDRSPVRESEPVRDPSRDPLPLHLRVAPELAGPRTKGTEDFLTGLLSPVRSGAILTRSDLAAISSRLDLGLRAGERRYALEHLLAQDAVGVLRELSGEVARQGRAHRQREVWLGSPATFLAERAERTADVLTELSRTAADDDSETHQERDETHQERNETHQERDETHRDGNEPHRTGSEAHRERNVQ